jgi:O-antigen ligase
VTSAERSIALTFLYPFLNLFQPGILWPELAPFRPGIIMGLLAWVAGTRARPVYARAEAFRHPMFRAVCAFLLAQVLSVHYGGVASMLEEASDWSVYLVYVVASILLLSDADAVRRYVWGMIVGGTWLVCYGIYAVMNRVGYGATGRAGAYGMYENHNDYTFVILQILPFVYAYLREETGFLKRAFLFASAIACAAGVLLSLSRGGILALLLEALLIVLIAMTSPRRWLLIPVLAIVGAGAIGYQWAKRDATATTYTAETAESSRLELWRAARKMFLDRPLLGVGSRRFPEYSPQYEELSYDQRGKNSHNTLFEILATTGLFGFIPFVVMCWSLVRAMRSPTPATAPPVVGATSRAILIAFCTILFRGMFDAKTYDWSFYTLVPLAIACAMIRAPRDEEEQDPFARLVGGAATPSSG